MRVEQLKRSLLKAFNYSFAGSVLAGLVVFSMSRKPELAVAVGLVYFVLSIFLFILLERLWLLSFFGIYHKKGHVFWLTGLPSSGKSSLAKLLHEELQKRHQQSVWLDGDQIRKILPSLGFSRAEREEHIRRVAVTAGLLAQQGNQVVVSLVSPYVESRHFAREYCENFHEIFVDAPVQTCKGRDVKGLYRKAEVGLISNLTGFNDTYEAPISPELHVKTGEESLTESFKKLKKYAMKIVTK